MGGRHGSWRWVALGLLACSDSHGDAVGGEGEAPVVDEAYLRARCQHQARCDPAGLSAYPGSDVDGCVMLWGCILSGSVPAACTEAMADAPCEPWALDDVLASDACRVDIPVPAPAPVPAEADPGQGELCFGFGCGDGLACDHSLAEPRFCGVCVPGGDAAVGESCAGAFRCSRRAFCNDEQVCEAKRPDREPCDVSSECVSRHCGEDGRCYTPGPEDPCDTFRDCPPGLLCRDGACDQPPDLGEPCDPGELFDIAPGLSGARGCKAPLLCIDGRCEPGGCVSRVGLGEPCGALVMCEGVAVCDFGDGRCRELPGLGDPCDPEDRQRYGIVCGEGYCDVDAGRCVARAQAGEACESSAQCEDRSCVEGRCESMPVAESIDDCQAL